MNRGQILVDPAVSQAKFAREVGQFRSLTDEHARNGCWLAKAEYPEAFVVFGTPKMTPSVVAFGVIFDFSNYDLWPVSVTLVNPFTRTPYKAKELPTLLHRRAPAPAIPVVQGSETLVFLQAIMQSYGPDEMPFVCLPGIREYHDHPGHSGDSWLLRRGGAEGTLHNLVTHLYHYGTEFVTQYQVAIKVNGFQQGEFPA